MPIELEKSDDNNSKTAEDSFLNELKSQFDKEIDLRKNLDAKANTMITVASGVSTLLIGIGTFLISRILERNVLYDISIAILGVGIVLAVLGIWRFIQSYSLRDYTYPIGHEWFFPQGAYKKDRVDSVRSLTTKEFSDRLYKGYLECIKTSAEINKNRAVAVRKGQKFLAYSIITTAVLVVFILVSMGMGVIRLS